MLSHIFNLFIFNKVLHREALLTVTLHSIIKKEKNIKLAVSGFQYCSTACNEVQKQEYTYLQACCDSEPAAWYETMWLQMKRERS